MAKARVAITQNLESIDHAVVEALARLDLNGEIKGKLVAIKPNETWASAKDSKGVTQPDTLRAVIREMKKRGPKSLVVTGGSGAAKTDEVFRVSGLMKVCEDESVEFHDHNLAPFVDVELPYAPEKDVKGPQKSVKVNARVLEYETIVAVNQLKLHETATVTLSLKNIAMSFPAAGYYGYPRHSEKHANKFFDDMHSFIAAMAKRFRPKLAITVGHPAMIATGPLGGHCVETGLCIASTDPLAADVVGAKLLGFNVQGVRHLWEAQRLGVGVGDMEEIEFPCMSLKEAIEAFTTCAYGETLTFEHA